MSYEYVKGFRSTGRHTSWGYGDEYEGDGSQWPVIPEEEDLQAYMAQCVRAMESKLDALVETLVTQEADASGANANADGGMT